MPRQEFGFVCGKFSIALSGNEVVLPMNQPLRKSLLPYASMDETAGLYTLRVTFEGKVVCNMPVHVVWVGHKSQPQPFLGLKTDDPAELRQALAVYAGKPVDLKFTPRG